MLRVGFRMPQAQKWSRMLPDIENVIRDKLNSGFDVAFVDGPKEETGGPNHVESGVWLGLEDPRGVAEPVPIDGEQMLTRAKLRGALVALDNKRLGV